MPTFGNVIGKTKGVPNLFLAKLGLFAKIEDNDMPEILQHVVKIVTLNGFDLLHCDLFIINIVWHNFNSTTLNFWPVAQHTIK